MIQVYHNSVGRNTVMELDFAVDRSGQVDHKHATLYLFHCSSSCNQPPDRVRKNHLKGPSFAICFELLYVRDLLLISAGRARYKAMGDWIRSCYGTPVASGSTLTKQQQPGGALWSVEIDTGDTAVDRIVIRENQTAGQRILR